MKLDYDYVKTAVESKRQAIKFASDGLRLNIDIVKYCLRSKMPILS